MSVNRIWMLWPISVAALPRLRRRRPEIELESWSQPWPCPHRGSWALAWGLTSHGPSAEHVRANARCTLCGGLVFDDPARLVPERFPARR